MRRIIHGGLMVLAASVSLAAQADIYLTSANAWIVNPNNGSNAGGAWEFENIPNGVSAEMKINNTPRGTTFLLQPGNNLFTFQIWANVTNDHAIGLWFGDNANHFPGPNGAMPHLVVYRDTQNQLAFPAQGVFVNTWGGFSPDGPYHGETSFTIGGMTATVTEYSLNGLSGVGTFTIRMGDVPAPGALALLTGAGLLARGRRRRA